MMLRSDIRTIVRDPMLRLLSLLPLALAVVVRFSAPAVIASAMLYIDGDTAASVLAAGLLLLTPMMFGFVYGLMLLDERDQGVLAAIAVTPTGKTRFMVRRMAVPMLWSAITALLVVPIAGIMRSDISRLLVLSVLCGLQAPMLALFIGSVSRDKVSGMAVAKIGTFLIALGALGVLVPGHWKWVAAASPHYWVSALVIGGENSLVMNSLAAVAVHLIAILTLALAFSSSTD